MPAEHDREPWEQIEALLPGLDEGRLRAYLATLSAGETARALSRLSADLQANLLTRLLPREAADLLTGLPQAQAAALLATVPPAQAGAVLAELPSDERADLLAWLDAQQAAEILAQVTPEIAEGVRRLAQYAPDSAGGLMSTEYLAYPDGACVAEILADLRCHGEAYARYPVQYAFLVDGSGNLVGVLRLRDLLLTPPQTPARSVMIADPVRLRVETPLEEVIRFFARHPFFGAPVTDAAGRLLGVVLRADAEKAALEQAERRFRWASGLIGGEEFRSMAWRSRLVRRLAWLGISLGLNLLAASIVGLYQDTLSAVITLAVFLPVISGMGGNSGSQALAVSIRELALGLLQPNEYVWVLLKEAGVGITNGLVLGTLLGSVAFWWGGNPYLGLVVGAAMTLSSLVAVCLGGTLPLMLRTLNLDPAIASGPILTTITDMCGFFFALALASGLLHLLVP